MNENNKTVGIELRTPYDGSGVDQAVKDQRRLTEESQKEEARRTAAAEAYERKRAEIAERIRQREERDAAARQSALDKEAAATKQSVDDLTGSQETLAMAATAGRIALIGAAAAGAGAVAMTLQLGQSWAKAAEEIGTLSQRTQISIEELSLMRAEAIETDVKIEKLATGYKNLSVKMFDAISGKKESRALFKALGVEVTDSTGRLRDSRDVMDDVATVFSRMDDGAEKTAIAVKLLGKGIGDDLVPYLNQGGEKLKGLREEAERLGLKMDSETVKAVKDMKDNIELLKLSAEGAAGELAGPFFQSLVKITAELRKGRQEGGWLWALMRGGGAAANEFFTDSSVGGLQQRAGLFSSNIRDMEAKLADPKVRGNQRLQLEENLRAALQGQAAIYRQIGEIEGSGVEDAPGKTAPPPGLGKDSKTGRTGKQPMTFEELLAKGAAKREQLYEEREREADAALKREQTAAAREDAERLRNIEREDKALEQLARRYKDVLDPMEPLRREMAQLEELYKKGKLTQDEYSESLFNLQEKMEALNKGVKPARDEFKELKDAMYGWGRETSRDLARMAVEGEISLNRLGQAAKNLVIDLIAARIQKQMIEPLINEGIDSAGGFLKEVFKGVFGGGGAPTGGGGGAELMMVAHQGGVAGEHYAGRYVHPAYIERAPRYHKGGIAGDEVPAVLQRGEEVITRQDPRHRYNGGGGSNIKVEIINQGRPQEAVSATPSFDIDGMVIRIVTRDLNQGGPIRQGVESVTRGVG